MVISLGVPGHLTGEGFDVNDPDPFRSEVRAWLEGKGLAKDLAVIEWSADTGAEAWLTSSQAAGALARLLGLPVGVDLFSDIGADRIFLDGLVSVWHPENGR